MKRRIWIGICGITLLFAACAQKRNSENFPSEDPHESNLTWIWGNDLAKCPSCHVCVIQPNHSVKATAYDQAPQSLGPDQKKVYRGREISSYYFYDPVATNVLNECRVQNLVVEDESRPVNALPAGTSRSCEEEYFANMVKPLCDLCNQIATKDKDRKDECNGRCARAATSSNCR